MYVCIAIQMNLHVGFNIRVTIHQTCRRYIDESTYIYAHTHKYARENEYLHEYVCRYAYTGEYILI
jgi:hypothetical protein